MNMKELEDLIEVIKPKEEFSLTNKAGTKGVKCIIGPGIDEEVAKTGIIEIIPGMISIKQIEGRYEKTCRRNHHC